MRYALVDWACITLDVHSTLTMARFLAVITSRIAHSAISFDPVSAVTS